MPAALSHPVLTTVLAAVIVTTIIAAARGLRRWVLAPAFTQWFRDQVTHVVEPMFGRVHEELVAELRPNGGGSLRDQVDQMNVKVDQVVERVDSIQERVDKISRDQ